LPLLFEDCYPKKVYRSTHYPELSLSPIPRWELINIRDNTDGSVNFIPKMNREVLIQGYQKIIKTIYSPGKYYKRISQFLKYYKPANKRRLSPEHIRALLKSILYIGILGNGITQMYYWRLFLKTLFFYRKSFAEAMTMIIYGQHFRKILNKVCSLNSISAPEQYTSAHGAES
jgi:hypothetical protein